MKPVVIFGTCRERMAYWEHIDSVLAAQRYLVKNGVSVGMVFDSPTYIREGRQRIARHFLETDGTHLCFVDSDNMLHERTVWELLKYDLPLVSALYFQRRGMPEAVARVWADPTERTGSRSDSQRIRDWMVSHNVPVSPEPQIIDTWGESLLEVDVVGFGCVLIKRELIETLYARQDDIFGDHNINVGEDVYFCRLAQDAGEKIYVDLKNIIGHLTHYDVTLSDFMQVGRWELEGEDNGV